VTTPTGQQVQQVLSACMMVRDEEANLPRCLESIKGFVDELIVVDTGSTDKTVEIAESFGAKVYHHPWENDFSKHRNQSISYAAGDWLFIIDADEELIFDPKSNIEKTRTWLDVLSKEHRAVAINLKDMQKGRMTMQLNSSRFFRKGEAKYIGAVHNQPENLRAVFCPHVFLHHYGYDLTPEEKEAKRLRTTNLLLREVEDNPTNYQALFYLSQEYASHRDWENSVIYCEKYIAHKDELEPSGNFYEAVYYTGVRAYMRIGDLQKSKEWLTAGCEALPTDLDMALALTEFGAWTSNSELIVRGARTFVALYDNFEKDPYLRGNRFIFSNNPEVIVYCLKQLTSTLLKEGFERLEELLIRLEKCNEKYAEGTVEDLQAELGPLGLQVDLGGKNNV